MAAAAALGLLCGIQLLRVFLPLANFTLHDAARLPPAAVGGLSLAVFALGLTAPALARRWGWRRAISSSSVLLAATRLGEQLTASPAGDVWISAAGSALLAVHLGLLLQAAALPPIRRARLALAVVAALGLETALRTLGGTLDLSWQPGPAAALMVLALVATCLVCALLARGSSAGAGGALPAARRWSWLALGSGLALYLLVFSNPAHLAARSGLPLERASAFVLGGWLAGLALLGALPFHAGWRWRAVEAAVLTIVGTWMAVFAGDDAWFGMLIGTPAFCVLLFDLLASSGEPPRRTAAGAAGIVALTLLYLAYARFDQALAATEPQIYGGALALFTIPCLVGAWRARAESPPSLLLPWSAVMAIAAGIGAVVFLGAPGSATISLPIDTSGPIRVMTYNLHQGFGVAGDHDPEALARAIELERPDIVALQEVSRGWLVTGGLDLYEWMRRRLRLEGVFAGAADAQWGNALLTRLPIEASRSHPLPPDDLPMRRAVLDVTVRTGRGPLRLLCVHLHHRRDDHVVRERQVEALLEIWDGTPGTVLLGDFNALPGSAAMARLRAAGLRDASTMLPSSGRGTTTRLDGRQIDWIFATRDLAFEWTSMRYTRASDHLPLATTLHLTTRFRGAPPPAGEPESRTPPG